MEITEDRIYAGISLYSRKLLYFYDWLLLGACCRLLWNCPSRHMLALYNEYISANHLDIGVGSGYFMDRCRFPSSRPRLALMDLSPILCTSPVSVWHAIVPRFIPGTFSTVSAWTSRRSIPWG